MNNPIMRIKGIFHQVFMEDLILPANIRAVIFAVATPVVLKFAPRLANTINPWWHYKAYSILTSLSLGDRDLRVRWSLSMVDDILQDY